MARSAGWALIGWLVVIVGGVGCQEQPTVTKLEAFGMDPAQWEADYCATGDWYGDGECDDFCPETDDDCDPALQAKVDLFVGKFEKEYAALLKTAHLASWKTATTNAPEAYQEHNNAMVKLFLFSLDKERHDTIRPFLEHKSKLNLLTRRSLEVMSQDSQSLDLPVEQLSKLLEIVQLQNEASSLFNSFSGELDGETFSRIQLRQLLRSETDPARRKQIWEALRQLGPKIAPKVIKAVKLANEVAVSVGYNSAWDYYLNTLQDQKPEQIISIFAEVDTLIDGPYREMKAQLDKEVAARFKIQPDALMIWHHDDAFFQAVHPTGEADLDKLYVGKTKEEVVQLAAGFFDKLGLNVADVLPRSDLYERENKATNAFMIDIDREGDIRVLLNARPDHRSLATAVHELGHAADYKYLDSTLPFLLRTSTHTLTTEAMALFFEDQTLTPEFLIEVVGAQESQINKIEQQILAHHRRQELIFARWSMVMFQFEKALYENPDQDLNSLWWDLVERYQGVKRPPGRDMPDWACKSHITTSPIYYHNYLIGKMFGAQLRSVMATAAKYDGPLLQLSVLREKDSVSFLKKKVLRVGRELHWWELVQLATGESLKATYFADELKQTP